MKVILKIGCNPLSLLFFVVILTGCSKKTSDTASQGLDVSQTQVKQSQPAVENSPPSQGSSVQEKAVGNETESSKPIKPEMSLKDVYFDFDSSLIRSDMKTILDDDVLYLKKKEMIKVIIEGNCDERGTGEYNLALGNKRAYSVRKVLIAEGVDKSRLSTVSFGKERPLCHEHNEDCYKLNRRAHFNVR